MDSLRLSTDLQERSDAPVQSGMSYEVLGYHPRGFAHRRVRDSRRQRYRRHERSYSVSNSLKGKPRGNPCIKHRKGPCVGFGDKFQRSGISLAQRNTSKMASLRSKRLIASASIAELKISIEKFDGNRLICKNRRA